MQIHPSEQVLAKPEAAGQPLVAATEEDSLPSESEVWQLLGRADVILRGVLQVQDRPQRRLWEERARAWLQDVDQAWISSQRRPW